MATAFCRSFGLGAARPEKIIGQADRRCLSDRGEVPAEKRKDWIFRNFRDDREDDNGFLPLLRLKRGQVPKKSSAKLLAGARQTVADETVFSEPGRKPQMSRQKPVVILLDVPWVNLFRGFQGKKER